MNKIQPTILAALLLAVAAMSGCTPQGDGGRPTAAVSETTTGTNEAATTPAEAAAGDVQPSITGTIDHSTWTEGQTSTVTFARFPATLAEWQQAQRVLGAEPQGTVALQVMAFELFRRNPADGRRALELNNTGTNYRSTLERVQQLMDTKDTNYARPYIAAALLKGATPDNGYHAATPYQVEVRVNPAVKYQDSQMLQGSVIYLQVDAQGWDTNWRGVEVVKPEGQPYYVVSNCPALYTQCKAVKGTWAELE